MITLQKLHSEAKKYSNGNERIEDAFIAGFQFATYGQYRKAAELFDNCNIPTFDEWWATYNKKRGRKKAEEKWNKLKPQQKIACMKATPAYVQSTPVIQYRLDPLTYLNGERWNDEIIQNSTYEQQRTEQLVSKAARILASSH